MPREAQPKAVVQPKDVFSRCEFAQLTEEEARNRELQLIGAAVEIANEQVIAMVTEWRDDARKAQDECSRLRSAVKRAADKLNARSRSIEAQAAKRVADLQAQVATLQAGGAAEEDEALVLTAEDLQLLTGTTAG